MKTKARNCQKVGVDINCLIQENNFWHVFLVVSVATPGKMSSKDKIYDLDYIQIGLNEVSSTITMNYSVFFTES